MTEIIRGTTPTIKYTFKVINVSQVSLAYLTIKYGGTVVIEKDIVDAVVGEGSISWTLSQADTLKLTFPECRMMLNWVLEDGTRGASLETQVHIRDNHKNEVI